MKGKGKSREREFANTLQIRADKESPRARQENVPLIRFPKRFSFKNRDREKDMVGTDRRIDTNVYIKARICACVCVWIGIWDYDLNNGQ